MYKIDYSKLILNDVKQFYNQPHIKANSEKINKSIDENKTNNKK